MPVIVVIVLKGLSEKPFDSATRIYIYIYICTFQGFLS